MSVSVEGVVTGVDSEITHRLQGRVVLTMPDFTADNLGWVLAKPGKWPGHWTTRPSDRRNGRWPRHSSQRPRSAASSARSAACPCHPTTRRSRPRGRRSPACSHHRPALPGPHPPPAVRPAAHGSSGGRWTGKSCWRTSRPVTSARRRCGTNRHAPGVWSGAASPSSLACRQSCWRRSRPGPARCRPSSRSCGGRARARVWTAARIAAFEAECRRRGSRRGRPPDPHRPAGTHRSEPDSRRGRPECHHLVTTWASSVLETIKPTGESPGQEDEPPVGVEPTTCRLQGGCSAC